jgi:hypothetical protein
MKRPLAISLPPHTFFSLLSQIHNDDLYLSDRARKGYVSIRRDVDLRGAEQAILKVKYHILGRFKAESPLLSAHPSRTLTAGAH